MNKITLFLMSEKGFQVLRAIVEAKLIDMIDFVVIAKDKNVLNDYSNEITDLAKNNSIKTFDKSDDFTIKSDYTIAISWRWIIDENKSKLIVIHDSLLPKYRGFAPLVNMMINGEKKIGATALFANKDYDCGDIIEQRSARIDYPLKISKAIQIVSGLYQELILIILNKIKSDLSIKSTAQKDSEASYSLWRDDEDYFIDWTMESTQISRFIDAVGEPYLAAKSYLDNKQIRILDSEIFDDVHIENRDVGKVIFIADNKPVIVCGKGLLKINKAIYIDNNDSILPLKKMRVRFK